MVDTWCYVTNVKNPVNLDICFPDLEDPPPYFSHAKYKENSYVTYSPDDFLRSQPKPIRLYRCRLKGIMFISPCADIDIKLCKFSLIKMCKMTGCIFRCRIYGIDNYGRLWAELFDPVTNASLQEKLLRKNPSALRKFTLKHKK